MMKFSLAKRFGFLANETARLYSQQFDRLAREKLGLSQAQVRLLAVLSTHGETMSQAELAKRMGLTPMAIATLCDRMAATGWIERRASANDRRVNELHMMPRAAKALEGALAIGDDLSSRALAKLTSAERTQLIALLAKSRDGLLALAAPADTEA